MSRRRPTWIWPTAGVGAVLAAALLSAEPPVAGLLPEQAVPALFVPDAAPAVHPVPADVLPGAVPRVLPHGSAPAVPWMAAPAGAAGGRLAGYV